MLQLSQTSLPIINIQRTKRQKILLGSIKKMALSKLYTVLLSEEWINRNYLRLMNISYSQQKSDAEKTDEDQRGDGFCHRGGHG